MNRPAPAPRSQSVPKRQFRVCAPIKRGDAQDQKTFWPRVGTAWQNEPKDGKAASISIRLDAMPFTGELVLFEDDGTESGASEGDQAR